jgi:hypothetical protein
MDHGLDREDRQRILQRLCLHLDHQSHLLSDLQHDVDVHQVPNSGAPFHEILAASLVFENTIDRISAIQAQQRNQSQDRLLVRLSGMWLREGLSQLFVVLWKPLVEVNIRKARILM